MPPLSKQTLVVVTGAPGHPWALGCRARPPRGSPSWLTPAQAENDGAIAVLLMSSKQYSLRPACVAYASHACCELLILQPCNLFLAALDIKLSFVKSTHRQYWRGSPWYTSSIKLQLHRPCSRRRTSPESPSACPRPWCSGADQQMKNLMIPPDPRCRWPGAGSQAAGQRQWWLMSACECTRRVAAVKYAGARYKVPGRLCTVARR